MRQEFSHRPVADEPGFAPGLIHVEFMVEKVALV
jgi:hypothetical protein